MSRKPPLTLSKHGAIDALFVEGLKLREVVKGPCRSWYSVRCYVDDVEGCNGRQRSVGEKKLDDRDRRFNVRMESSRKVSAGRIRKGLSISVTEFHVQRILSVRDHLQYGKPKQTTGLGLCM